MEVEDSRNSQVSLIHIVVDLTFPMTEDISLMCLEALKNVLTWALFAQDKVPLVGISSISSTVQHGLQFTPLTANTFTSISSSLRAVFKNVEVNAQMRSSDFNDSLTVTITSVIQQFREKLQEGPFRYNNNKFVATVISCRDGQLIGDWLDSLDDDLIGRCVDTFQVVELSRARILQPSLSVYPTRGGGGGGGRPAVHLALVPTAGAGAAHLEEVLRLAWFAPPWSELLPVELELGAGRGAGLAAAVAVRCVVSQCVLDPARLPFPEQFTLLASGGGGGGGSNAGGRKDGGGGRGVQVLGGVSRVAADGLAEGSLFGLPLRVTWSPLAAFRWCVDEYRGNAHLFLALRESLADADEYLVVKAQCGGRPGGVTGHFVLMPGDECMLLRAVASAELVLPPPPPPPLQYDGAQAARAQREVRGALDTLPVVDQYRAKRFPSGLCAALGLFVDFPQRLSLSRQHPTARPPSGSGSGSSVPPPQPQLKPAAAPPPLQHQQQRCSSGDRHEDAIAVLSSDDDLELLDVNVLARPRPRRPRSVGVGVGLTHKLGTGGHPALQGGDDAAPPTKRHKKARPLPFRVF